MATVTRPVETQPTPTFTHPLSGDSGPSGEHFVLHRSSRSPEGVFRFTWTLKPGKSGPGEHRHPNETHSMKIMSGVLVAWIDGVRHEYKAGDSFVIPAGVRHRFKNPGKVPVVVDAANDGPMFEDFVVPVAVEMQRRGGKMTAGMMMVVIAQAMKHDVSRPTLRSWPLWIIVMAFGTIARLFARPLPPVLGWDVGAPPPPDVSHRHPNAKTA